MHIVNTKGEKKEWKMCDVLQRPSFSYVQFFLFLLAKNENFKFMLRECESAAFCLSWQKNARSWHECAIVST